MREIDSHVPGPDYDLTEGFISKYLARHILPNPGAGGHPYNGRHSNMLAIRPQRQFLELPPNPFLCLPFTHFRVMPILTFCPTTTELFPLLGNSEFPGIGYHGIGSDSFRQALDPIPPSWPGFQSPIIRWLETSDIWGYAPPILRVAPDAKKVKGGEITRIPSQASFSDCDFSGENYAKTSEICIED